MRKIFGLIFALILVLTGCTIPGTYMPGNVYTSSIRDKLLKSSFVPVTTASVQKGYLRSEISDNYQYHIGPYDMLNVIVWNHPELALPSTQASYSALSSALTASPMFTQTNSQLSGIFVDTKGDINFPLIDNVNVAGLTTDQARDKIKQRLSNYIRRPQVSLQVIAFNSQRVIVIGEVTQPGLKPLTDRPLTILDAINLCGGINQASADAAHIYVIRGGIEQKTVTVYWLSANSPQSLLLAEHFKLVANDIVYVSPAGIATWNRVVSQILPTVQTVWNTWSMIRSR